MTSAATQTDRLLIVGALHVDDIATSCGTLVPHASNPVTWQQRVGGVAANAAFAAKAVAAENRDIVFCAATGSDPVADQLARAIADAGLIARLQRMAGCSTGRYTAVMDRDGELHIGLSDVALAETLDPDKIPLVCPQAPCQALLVDANLAEQCLISLSEETSALGIPLAAMSVSPAKSRRLLGIASSIDLLFINRREAIAMIDQGLPISTEIRQLADGLARIGFSRFVLTDALRPVLIQDGDQQLCIAVPIVDAPRSVNGAGDALAGASFAAWCAGVTLADAVRDYGLIQSARIVSGERLPVSL